MDITINDKDCMICGKAIGQGNRVRAHLIPKNLKPKFNVFTYFHKECEDLINKLYVSQQKKPEHERVKKKVMNILKDCRSKIKMMETRIMEDGDE